MIDLSQAKTAANSIGVSPEVVIMEIYQMVLLDELSGTPLSKKLVFKGGTCLRLAYNSFRFSEDLDFSLLLPVGFADFSKVVKKIAAKYPEMNIIDLFDMKQTLFAKLAVGVGDWRVGIKIEISKRKENWRRSADYQLKLLQSPLSGSTPLINTATLKKIYQDKILTAKNREKPRDWFDLWFLAQKLGKSWDNKIPLSKKLMLDRVRFLLPRDKRRILAEFKYES